MNKEDYVSLEVAELLEEKGCNLSSDRCYIGGRFTESDFTEDCDDVYYSAPTLYEAQKMFRINHRIHICVDCCVFGWTCILYNVVSGEKLSQVYGCKDSYEEALNAGILEALKIL